MPRGQRDFGMYAASDVMVGISDMGELAARLGSILIFDRRGLVIDFDNFEDSILKWHIKKTGGTDYARLDSTYARSGSQAVKLHTNGDVNDYVQLYKRHAIRASLQLGIEASFSQAEWAVDFLLGLYFWDGTDGWDARVKIIPAGGELYFYNTGLGYTLIEAIGTIHAEGWMFHTMKLVVDFTNHKYKRLLFDNHEYDLSANALPEVGAAGGAYTTLYAENRQRAAGLKDIWVEDIIFTQDEP